MVMLIAPTGRNAGHPIWSCSTYPRCRGMVAFAGDPPRRQESPPVPSVSRQVISRARLLAIGLVLMVIVLMYLLAAAFTGPR
jgi:hypothetical protein